MTLPQLLLKFRCYLTELTTELKLSTLYRNMLFIELYAEPQIILETRETINRLIATGREEKRGILPLSQQIHITETLQKYE